MMIEELLSSEQIEKICSQVTRYLSEAVGDMAMDVPSIQDMYDYYEEIGEKYAGLNIKPTDWRGWLADQLYNDRGVMSDLAGDKIANLVYYEMTGDKRLYVNRAIERVQTVYNGKTHIHNMFC